MTGKMDKTTIIVLSIVGALGLLSVILGFSAEGTKLTDEDILAFDGVCYYPKNSALALGVCAAIFLVISQVVFAVVGGCCGCCKSRAMPSETNRIIGVVCAVVSWIAAIIGFALFVEGASSNAEGPREVDTFGLCYYLKPGIFAGAAILALASTALAITSYLKLRKQPDAAAADPKAAAGVAMGQPQFPQQSPPQGYVPQFPQQSPPPQAYVQAPPPSYPQYSQQGYGAQAPNQQYPPPGQSYAPNQQYAPSPPPAQGYAPAPAPNQQAPPPQGHGQV